MHRRLFSRIAQSTAALVAVAFFAGPAAADTIQIPSPLTPNGPYHLTGADSVTVFAPGAATGSSGTTSEGLTYFDYIYEFTTSQPSYIRTAGGPTDGSGAAFTEFHLQIYNGTAPAGDADSLFTGDDREAGNTNLIDTGPDSTWDVSGSVGKGPGSGPGPVMTGGASAYIEPTEEYPPNSSQRRPLLSLQGTYFLRLFGILDPSATEFALTATISTTLAATPIPAALPLFLTALGGLGFVARRRKTAA